MISKMCDAPSKPILWSANQLWKSGFYLDRGLPDFQERF